MISQSSNHLLIIAISNQKGGVAKTTTAFSLSACLTELGQRVLVIDLDPQAHLTQSFGINPDRVRHTIGEVLLKQASMLSVTRESNVPNLDIVPANEGLILIDKILYGSQKYEYRMKDSLAILGERFYDVILIDCPPSFGPLTLNALTASDMVVIPVTCDYFSVQSLQNYLELFSLVRKKSNPQVGYRLLVTLFDGRTRLSKMILEQYRQKYPSTMFETVIPMDVKLRESPLFGRPITQYASKARGAQEYRALARELITCKNVMN